MTTSEDKNPERTKRLALVSKIIVVVTAIGWALYDVLPAVNGGRGDTISENIRDWSRSWWVLPYIWGALATHFFVNIGQPPNYRDLFFVFAAVGLVLLAGNAVTHFYFSWVPVWQFRAGMVVLGGVAATVLWAQHP